MSYAYDEDKMLQGIRDFKAERPAINVPVSAPDVTSQGSGNRVPPLIQEAAALFFIHPMQLLSDSREPCALHAREAVALVLRKSGYSTPRIGAFLNRHHTTILNTLQNAEKRYDCDELFRKAVDALKRTRGIPVNPVRAVFDPARLEDELNADLPKALRDLAAAIDKGDIEAIRSRVGGVGDRHWADKRAHFLLKVQIAAPVRKQIEPAEMEEIQDGTL